MYNLLLKFFLWLIYLLLVLRDCCVLDLFLNFKDILFVLVFCLKGNVVIVVVLFIFSDFYGFSD